MLSEAWLLNSLGDSRGDMDLEMSFPFFRITFCCIIHHNLTVHIVIQTLQEIKDHDVAIKVSFV